MKYLYLLIFCLINFILPSSKKITIYLVGGSTMQKYNEEETPMRGWGQYLASFFDDKVELVNKAIGGRSTRTFIEEERWKWIVDHLQKDDWVFIQFGHNDQSTNPARHTSPEDYRKNLIMFINEVKSKKANPVLLTPITMRIFDKNEEVKNGLGVYPDIVREVAATSKIPLIDLNKKTSEYVSQLGNEASKDLYMWLQPGEHPKYPQGLKDNTHLQKAGAIKFASLAVEEIKNLNLKPLVKHLE